MINRIFESLATQMGIEVQNLERKTILEKLQHQDADLASQLTELSKNYDTLLFIRGDFELRHKLKDIYDFQIKNSQWAVDKSMEKLTSYCLTRGLELPEAESFDL